MALTAPPDIPLITDPSTFSVRAQDWVVWQAEQLYPELVNTSLVLSLSTSSTSVTSNTISTGAKTFTVQTGKGYIVGQSLSIANTAAPTNRMFAVVTSYDSGTGALGVTVQAIEGSGTYTAWSIALAFNGVIAYSQLAAEILTTQAQFDNDTSLATTAFVQRALGSYSGATNYGVNTTLTAADTGKVIYVSDAVTITMPAASAIPAGGVIEIIAGTNGVVVQRADTDTFFDVSSSTSITLNMGDSVKFRSNGTSAWLATAGTMRDFLSAEFTTQVAARFTGSNRSLAASGYQKLPGGLIIQWGIATVAQDSSTTVTLPIAFPNAGLSAQVSIASGSLIAVAEGIESYANLTTTQITLRNGVNTSRDMTYLAIGY